MHIGHEICREIEIRSLSARRARRVGRCASGTTIRRGRRDRRGALRRGYSCRSCPSVVGQPDLSSTSVNVLVGDDYRLFVQHGPDRLEEVRRRFLLEEIVALDVPPAEQLGQLQAQRRLACSSIVSDTRGRLPQGVTATHRNPGLQPERGSCGRSDDSSAPSHPSPPSVPALVAPCPLRESCSTSGTLRAWR